MQNLKQEIVLYTGPKGAEKVEVHMDKDTVWLTQAQIAQLFDTDRSSITRHVNNVINSAELSENSNVQFLHIAGSDKPVKYYSLDMILSVGYRVNSKRATQFRVWATSVLQDHIMLGYTINEARLKETTSRAHDLERAAHLLM